MGEYLMIAVMFGLADKLFLIQKSFMLNVTIDEIQRDPLKYLRQVEAGVTFVIIQADKPIAELRPIPSSGKQLRPFGLCAGEFTVPDDFDASLPEDILSAFEGK